MPYREEFQIANPSPYPRSDYVEVDLASLNVPPGLDHTTLRLLRSVGTDRHVEVPYQIDEVLGSDNGIKLLTFFSSETPPASDNYTQPSLTYILEETAPNRFLTSQDSHLLQIYYYYADRVDNGPLDGYGGTPWDIQRPVYKVKLSNGDLEVVFCLVPYLGIDYTGSATNVLTKDAAQYGVDEMLCPFNDSATKRWGQLDHLVFFSLPWETRWFHEVNILGSDYDLVWANAGPMRAVLTLRTKPFQLAFNGEPYVDKPIVITAQLYRVIYVYPKRPYYTEELFVLTKEGATLAFRPYFTSVVTFPPMVPARLAIFEHIPNYFTILHEFSGRQFSYGVASNARIREMEIHDDVLQWRIQLSYHKKCIYYFKFTPWRPYGHVQDPYNIIRHCWYERIHKPIEKIPLFNRIIHPPLITNQASDNGKKWKGLCCWPLAKPSQGSGRRCMAKEEYLAWLHAGVYAWNAWRTKHPDIAPDLRRADLSGANLHGADLRRADLSGTNFRGADLRGADLRGANLERADLWDANLHRANLSGANIARAELRGTDLSGANLGEARLSETMFVNVDLSMTEGLEACTHGGPSFLGPRTLQQSGRLPLAFLRGCGLPDRLIDYLPSLLDEAIQYYSCFISYSSKDDAFAKRLHADLQNNGVRCWFAPHHLPIGAKTWDAIDAAIRLRDKLLLILSKNAIASDWVEDEVGKAFAEEKSRKKTVLFPVRIDQAVMKTDEPWAVKLRDQRNIGDFRKWKDHDAYQQAFDRVLRDLKQAPG